MEALSPILLASEDHLLRTATYTLVLLASVLLLATVGTAQDHGAVPEGAALPVPEPQTLFYVGSGLLVLAVALRRRRRVLSVG